MMNGESSNSINNLQASWNFESIDNQNIQNENGKIRDASQNAKNQAKNTISQIHSSLKESKKKSNRNTLFDIEEQIAMDSQFFGNDQYYSGRNSLQNKPDVMKVSRPFTSQAKKRRKTTLFLPLPQPPKLTGPVAYYRTLEKIDKQLQRDFDENLRNKEIKKQMKSPYKEDLIRLRANSVRSVRNKLQKNEFKSRKQWLNENNAYRSACAEEYESEHRLCKVDYVSKTYHELRIMGV